VISDAQERLPRLPRLIEQATATFTKRFAHPPKWVAIGPGRVNLIGEHVDYNDGFVLPMAIDRHIVIAAAPASARCALSATESLPQVPSHISRLASDGQEQLVEIDTTSAMKRSDPAWANYVRGVIAGFQDRGITVPAFDAMVVSDLPMGGGLSSSAAIEMATASLLEIMTGHFMSLAEKALLCQRAEHEFARVPCGIMDQFASAMGRRDHLLLLDCRSQQISHVPLQDDSIAVLIVNSNVRHELSDGGYAQRRSQCEQAAAMLGVSSLRDATMADLAAAQTRMEPVNYRRARHVISEIQRTTEAAAAVEAAQWDDVGKAMYESHASLRDDFEVSCAELDLLVELARGISEGQASDVLRDSVIGCRMTGGGFGGCVVSLVKKHLASKVAAEISKRYELKTGIAATAFITRPADGAKAWLL